MFMATMHTRLFRPSLPYSPLLSKSRLNEIPPHHRGRLSTLFPADHERSLLAASRIARALSASAWGSRNKLAGSTVNKVVPPGWMGASGVDDEGVASSPLLLSASA
jgi:hypothetical protein